MILHEVVHAAMPYLTQQPFGCPPGDPFSPPPNCSIPVPPPVQPDEHKLPGFQRIVDLIGNIRWIAAASLVLIFFVGIIVWSAGRGVDHHRAGRVGTIMMLVGVLGALVWSLGPSLIIYLSGQ